MKPIIFHILDKLFWLFGIILIYSFLIGEWVLFKVGYLNCEDA